MSEFHWQLFKKLFSFKLFSENGADSILKKFVGIKIKFLEIKMELNVKMHFLLQNNIISTLYTFFLIKKKQTF